MKCIIFSDLHIAQHKKQQSRLNHCLEVLQWVFDVAKKQNVKNILFAGDLFQDRKLIDIMSYQRTFEVFQKNMSAADRPNVYLLLGNHDLFYFEKKDISSVYPLSSINGITVVNEPCSLLIEDQEIGFLPYTHNPLADLDKIRIKAKRKILIGHVAVHGALLNMMYGNVADVQIEGDNEMTFVGPEIFDNYDRVFLGHYHAAQELSKTVEYVGSPLQLNFGELSQDKHIVFYDSETDKRIYIRNTFSPIHWRFNSIKEAEAVALVGGLENQFVDVLDENIQSPEARDLRQMLIGQKVGSYSIRPQPKKAEQQKVDAEKMQQAVSILTNFNQMLEQYVDSIENLSFDRDDLLAVGKQICKFALNPEKEEE